jgi:hypothetical protein
MTSACRVITIDPPPGDKLHAHGQILSLFLNSDISCRSYYNHQSNMYNVHKCYVSRHQKAQWSGRYCALRRILDVAYK